MNLNDLEIAWKSVANNLPIDEQQRLVEQFTRQMVRRRRFHALWLMQTFIALTITSGIVFWAIAIGKVNIWKEWVLFPMLIVAWVFALHFLRRFLKQLSSSSLGDFTVAQSVQAAFVSNQSEKAHLKLVGLLFVLMIPLLAVSMNQLQAEGKVSPNELKSMVLFFGAILLLSGSGILARYFGRLIPQQKKLRGLLDELVGNEGQNVQGV